MKCSLCLPHPWIGWKVETNRIYNLKFWKITITNRIVTKLKVELKLYYILFKYFFSKSVILLQFLKRFGSLWFILVVIVTSYSKSTQFTMWSKYFFRYKSIMLVLWIIQYKKLFHWYRFIKPFFPRLFSTYLQCVMYYFVSCSLLKLVR